MELILTDKEILQSILDHTGWNQKELANALGITQGAVSQVINEQIKMRGSTRKLAEHILEKSQLETLAV